MASTLEQIVPSVESIQPEKPDLILEYPDQQVTLFGITGTIEDLLKMCPVPSGSMTLEAKNMFVVMALNEAEVPIKQEHMSIFEKIVESRGVELKVSVLTTEEPAALAKPLNLEPDHESLTKTDVNNELRAATVDNEVNSRALSSKNELEVQQTLSSPINLNETVVDPKPDEATSLQMDAWLTQMQAEYYQTIKAQDILESDLSPVNDVEIVANEENLDLAPIEDTSLIAELAKQAPETIVETKASEILDLADEDLGTAGLETISIELGEDEEEDEEVSIDYDSKVLLLEPKPEELIVINEDTETVTLAELLLKSEAVLSHDEPLTLVEQISQYVEKSQELGNDAVEVITDLISDIESLTQTFIELQQSTDFEPQLAKKIQLELEDICMELLNYLGIEYDDEILLKLIQTIIKQQSLNTETLVSYLSKEGTHEIKLYPVQNIMSSKMIRDSDFRLLVLGNFALWQQDKGRLAS